MNNVNTTENRTLSPYMSRLGVWAFSIGTSIGWGSFVVTCNTYLSQAGILGTVFGLLLGMIVILVINRNLCYMIERSPSAGGIYTYGKQVRGHDTGFLMAWFLLLTYLAILWANITSLPLFANRFLGPFFQFGFSYTVFGYRVFLGEALLSIAAIVLVGLLVSRSRSVPQYLMIIMALVFVGGLAVTAVIAVTSHAGGGFSYSPVYVPDKSEWGQIIRIAVISPWAFIGFENVAHFSEEFIFPVRKIRNVMLASVILTTLVYILMTLLSVSAYPPEYASWLEYIRDMGNLEGTKAIPAFYAAEHYMGAAGITVMIMALLAVIVTSIIGNLTAISRLLYAFGRDHEWMGRVGTVNRHKVPGKAILIAVAVSCLVPFLGRTAIGWIVDVTTLGAAIIYGFLSECVYRDATERGDRIERVTGVSGTVMMIAVAILLLAPRIISFEAMAPESYLLFAFWSLLGLVVFRIVLKRDHNNQYGHSIIVWVALLLLMLLTTMMWMDSRTQAVTEDSMNSVQDYFTEYAEKGQIPGEEADEFVTQQEDRIENANMRHTLSSFALLIIAVLIMAQNYRTARSQEQNWKKQLGVVREISLTDDLTGIKNKHAFTQWELQIDETINNGTCDPFAVVVCDINDLKRVNDQEGHLAGDECIKRACREICRVFAHSPVFRYGGDEFVTILRGEDYERRQELLDMINGSTETDQMRSEDVIAAGMAEYQPDQHNSLLRVFELADQRMYERKKELKEQSGSV